MNFGFAFMGLAGFVAGVLAMVVLALYVGHKDDE